MTPVLRVTDFEWDVNEPSVPDDEGTDGAPLWMHSQLQIGMASFHVNAYLAEWIVDGSYLSIEPQPWVKGARLVLMRDEETTGQLWQAFGMDGGCVTVTIEGKDWHGDNWRGEYAIFIEPHCT
jgi:hypothetical protein